MTSRFTQWSSAAPLVTSIPSWVSGLDRDRINAYDLYERIYWTDTDVFALSQRGSDASPIYIPTGRQIVETKHRYLANDISFVEDPEFGSDSERAEAKLALDTLMARERFGSRFNANKRYGIIRGDWLWHLYGNSERQPGSRLSIFGVDPGSYFPIYHPTDVDVIIGAHLVERILDDAGKERIRRLTYRKTTESEGPSPITVEEALFEIDKWGGPEQDEKIVQILRTPEQLPAPIEQIPLYHIPNFPEPGTIWGNSEIRGLERLMSAINQTVSDEDLTLALEGLGAYTTDAGSPIDADTGVEVPWNLGPGRVIELPPGSNFDRVRGVTSTLPFHSHLDYLHDQLDLTTGQPEVAKGRIEVQVAESGIALMLQMGPLLARVEEEEQVVTDVLNNMLWDLKSWFAAYEGQRFETIVWNPHYGEKVPANRSTQFTELMAMLKADPPIVSAAWVRTELEREFGYEFPENLVSEILAERTLFGQVEQDAFGARLEQEENATAASLGD